MYLQTINLWLWSNNPGAIPKLNIQLDMRRKTKVITIYCVKINA